MSSEFDMKMKVITLLSRILNFYIYLEPAEFLV